MSFWNKQFVLNYIVIYVALLGYSIAIYSYTWIFNKYVDLWRDTILIINTVLSLWIAAFILFIYYLIFWLLKVNNFLKKLTLFLGLLTLSMVDILITMISDWLILSELTSRSFFIKYGVYIPFLLIAIFFIVSAILIKRNNSKKD